MTVTKYELETVLETDVELSLGGACCCCSCCTCSGA